MNVVDGTDSDVSHEVVRSVTHSVTSQATRAGVDLKVGPWFSASAETMEASSKVNDGMHALILSRSQVDLFEATLDSFAELQSSLDPKFLRAIDNLPATYDYATYLDEVVEPFGTHYVSSATFGGLATMKTTAWHAYSGQTDTATLKAEAHAQWAIFGGGGSASHQQTSKSWNDGTKNSSETKLFGGDPAIGTFRSPDDWKKWAQSVERTIPYKTSYRLVELWRLVKVKSRDLGSFPMRHWP